MSYAPLNTTSDDEDSISPTAATQLYADYVEAYNKNIKPHDGPPTHKDIKLRMPRGGDAERRHRRNLSEATLKDPRFNPPPPSVWSRVLLLGGVALLLWLAVSLRLGLLYNKKGTKSFALRYIKEHAPPNAVPEGVEFANPTPPVSSVGGKVPEKEL